MKYKDRPSFRERGYTPAWDRLSKRFRQKNPLCADCLKRGITTAARVVDHIIPHKGNHALLMDETNLQSLCKTCHDSAKQAEERNGYVKGAGRDGMPVDMNHHWNQP